MYLYLVQHAEANSENIDPSRGLSEKGMSDIKRIAGHAAEMNVSVRQIMHSGKKRALQTAGVLAERITADEGVHESDGLAPMDDPEIWKERLSGADYNIMLVGHLPYMAKLTGLLVCGSAEKNTVNFEMGCIVCLNKSANGMWAVEWIIKPGMVK